MADPLMPQEILNWMRERLWADHHVEWHTVRQWDRLSPQNRAFAESKGWRRAAVQEGEADNGIEFLVMHRAMIELLVSAFPAHAALFVGWATPPTDPLDVNDPLPNGSTTPFEPDKVAAIQHLTQNVDSFATEDELGLFLETPFRPTSANPFARSIDPQTGIHNYLHNRFSDRASPVNLGNSQLNLGNQRFWRLHGWIDATWSAFRISKHLVDDAVFRAKIDAVKAHLARHAHPLGLETTVPLGPLPLAIAEPFTESLSETFQRLMTTQPEPATIQELRDYLQVALRLEFFTIPLYLTAMWSLKVTAATAGHRRILRDVAMEEMLHLGLVCNLLVALEDVPRLTDPLGLPAYPDVLPGIDSVELFGIEAFSATQIQKFMKIEEPKGGPIPDLSLAAVPLFHTIGDLYDAIDAGFDRVNPTFKQEGQLAYTVNGESLFVIRDISDAHKAIKTIKEQGEGTPTTQGSPTGTQVAHYYKFNQIYKQMKYTQQPDLTWKLDPTKPIPMPSAELIWPMAPVPREGYPSLPESTAFDQAYSEMTRALATAWSAVDEDTALDDAVTAMFGLGGLANTLMSMPRTSGGGNYGPTFHYFPTIPGPTAAAAMTEDASTETIPGFARIQQILDDAVNGQDFGAHGPFWRQQTRDEFVNFSVFGQPLLARDATGGFDPDTSNLVKALEGRPPFGSNVVPRPPGSRYNRMPDGFPTVPQPRIDEIRTWIGAGCPEVVPVGSWVTPNRVPFTDADHNTFWREFDNRFMFHATPQTRADINIFFTVADAWLQFAADPSRLSAWTQALEPANVGAAIERLELGQREEIIRSFGRPVSLPNLLETYERFGAGSLPADPLRPGDPHQMNGEIMWGFWSAFCDASLRLAPGNVAIPSEFWLAVSRGVLLGMLNDGVVRDRFTVQGFVNTPEGRTAMRTHAQDLPEADLLKELALRISQSGLL
jgi:hypothetical protein